MSPIACLISCLLSWAFSHRSRNGRSGACAVRGTAPVNLFFYPMVDRCRAPTDNGRSRAQIMAIRVPVQSGARRQLIYSFTRWFTDAVPLLTMGDRVPELWAIACRNYERSRAGIMSDRVPVESGARQELIYSLTRRLIDAVHLPKTGDR